MLGTLIGGALLGAALSGGGSDPKPPKKMSYDEAYEQAEDALGNQYRDNRQKVLDDINRNMISSGFYGQAPGDYLKQDAMTDMERDYEAQKSRYAQNLRNSNYAEAYQQYQHELQQDNRQFGNIGMGAALGKNLATGTALGGGWGSALGALAGAFF